MKISTVVKLVKKLGHESKVIIAKNSRVEDDTVDIVGTGISISVNRKVGYACVVTELPGPKFRFQPESYTLEELNELLKLELAHAKDLSD